MIPLQFFNFSKLFSFLTFRRCYFSRFETLDTSEKLILDGSMNQINVQIIFLYEKPKFVLLNFQCCNSESFILSMSALFLHTILSHKCQLTSFVLCYRNRLGAVLDNIFRLSTGRPGGGHVCRYIGKPALHTVQLRSTLCCHTVGLGKIS